MWFLTLHHWIDDSLPARDALRAHRAWVLKQHRAGTILVSGPTPEGSLGIMLVRAKTAAEVEALFSAEPLVARGRRRVEIIPWEVHEFLGFDLVGAGTSKRSRRVDSGADRGPATRARGIRGRLQGQTPPTGEKEKEE
jgi:uncharacterized protein YciI